MEDEVADRVCHHDGLRRHGRETVFGYLRLKGPTTISASPKTMMAGLAERRDGLQSMRRAASRSVPFRSLRRVRSEEHTSALQPLMRISYAVFGLKKKKCNHTRTRAQTHTPPTTYK